MGRIIEGVWDCTYCGSSKIRGSLRVCPVCSRQRDSNVKFYLDDPHNYVPRDQESKISENPDWICRYCDALNSDDVDECHECGADRSGAEIDYFESRREQEKQEQERYRQAVELLNRNKNNYNNYDQNSQSDYDQNSQSDYDANQAILKDMETSNRVSSIGSIFVAFIVLAGLIWMLLPKTQTFTVNEMSWERSITIQEYTTVDESGWTLPSGGHLQDKKWELRRYDNVLDHYETKTRTYTERELDHYETVVTGHKDLGNGHFKEITSQKPVYKNVTKTETYQDPVYRKEPVYDWKYYYEIDKWVFLRCDKSSGVDKSPYWNEQDLSDNQRENGRSATYKITGIVKKDKEKTYNFSFDEWNTINVGDTIKITTHIDGSAELDK